VHPCLPLIDVSKRVTDLNAAGGFREGKSRTPGAI
jgi:hypothetical protein